MFAPSTPEPPGSSRPTQWKLAGPDCSFCASAVEAKAAAATPKAASSDAVRFMTVLLLKRRLFRYAERSLLPLMRERPEAKLLLKDLPQAGEPVRLDDEEEDDQAAED